MTRNSSPMFLARQLLRRFKKNYGASLAHVELYFDNSKMMHARRQEVSIVRASRQEALSEQDKEDIRALKLDSVGPGHLDMEMPWDLLLRATETKMQCWELLARALFKAALLEGIPTVKVQSQNYSENAGSTTETMHDWGEADMSCAAAAAQLDDVLIATIDYDQILQTLCGMPSVAANSRWIGFKAETVDAGVFSEMYGPTDNHRLHASVLLLCAFKSDYSKSVCKKIGMTTAQLVQQMHVDTGKECLTEETSEGSRTLIFRPKMLLKCVRKPPPLTNLADILWTISYFRGYHGPRGPHPIVLPSDLFLKDTQLIITDV